MESYEWAVGGPVILVWNWCPVNEWLVIQLYWFGIGALGYGQF